MDKDALASIGQKFLQRCGDASSAASFLSSKPVDVSKNKNPFYTLVNPGSVNPLRRGDSESDILAKMYNFLTRDQKETNKEENIEKKARKEIIRVKDRRLAELIEAFGGDTKTKKPKKGFGKGLGLLALGTAGLLFSPDVMAMLSGFEDDFNKVFEGIDNVFTDITITTPPKLTGTGPAAPTVYDKEFADTEREMGLPAGLLKSIAAVETGGTFRTDLVSPKGAIGLMQFMPDTAREYGIDPRDPHQSIVASGKYMKKMMQRFQGDVPVSIAAYHAGPEHEAFKRGEIPLSMPMTRKYVEKVMDSWNAKSDQQAITGEFYYPLSTKGSLTGLVGEKRSDHVHEGIDIAVPVGTKVLSVHPGTVRTGQGGDAGKYVVVTGDDGMETKYFHLNDINVNDGDRVSGGQVIGSSGNTGHSTGPHLHLEMRKNGRLIEHPESVIPMPVSTNIARIDIREQNGSSNMSVNNNVANVNNSKTIVRRYQTKDTTSPLVSSLFKQ